MSHEQALPQGRITIVFTDIEKSSAMTSDLGNDRYKRQMRDPYAELLLAALTEHRGVLVQTQGDGFMAVFQRADDALACVFAVQTSLAQKPLSCAGKTDTWAVNVRIGVHTAEQEVFPYLKTGLLKDTPPTADNVEYPGGDTNFAARVGGLGVGGQAIVSASAYKTAATSGHYDWKDWPNRRLKSFEAAPETVWELLYDGQSRGEPGMRWVPEWYRGELNRFIARPQVQRTVFEHFKDRPLHGGVSRLVTLKAEGGMGKTRLALACAVEMVGLFQDGVYFVDLTSVAATRDAVAEAIAREMGLSGPDAGPDRLPAVLRRKETLLLLDNYEAVDNADVANFLCDLVAQTNTVRLLVTGREAVKADDIEQIVSLDDGMTPQESEDLFLAYARLKLGPGWAPDPGDRPQLARILEMTEGIPLATELTAAWVAKRSLSEIATGLEATPLEITERTGRGVRADRSPHHASLTQSLDWSYSLLARDMQAAFSRLGLFPTDFGAEAVAATTGVSSGEVRRRLDLLLDASLVRRQVTNGISRYRLHRFTHAYSETKLAALCTQEEISIMQQNQAHYFLDLAQEAVPLLQKPDHQTKVDRLETEVQNLSMALEWCLKNDIPLGLSVATDLWRFWWMRGHARLGLERLVSLLKKADDDLRATPKWAEAASVAGHLARHVGDNGQATTLYDQSLAAFNSLNDPSGAARVLRHLGVLAWHQHRSAETHSVLEEALLKSLEGGRAEDIAESHYELGNLARHQNDYDEAERHLNDSLAFFREAGDTRWIATALLALGNVTAAREKREDARSYYAESLRLFHAIRDKGRLALIFERIAALAHAEARPHQAVVLIGAAEKLREEIGSPLPAPDRKEYYDQLTADLQHSLGPAYKADREQGRSKSLEQAVGIADEEVSPR